MADRYAASGLRVRVLEAYLVLSMLGLRWCMLGGGRADRRACGMGGSGKVRALALELRLTGMGKSRLTFWELPEVQRH